MSGPGARLKHWCKKVSSSDGLEYFCLTFTVVSNGIKAEVLGVSFGLVWFGGFSWCLFRICCWFCLFVCFSPFFYILSVYCSGNISSFGLTTEVWTDSSVFLGYRSLNQNSNQCLAAQDYEQLAAAFFKTDLPEQSATFYVCLPILRLLGCKLGVTHGISSITFCH